MKKDWTQDELAILFKWADKVATAQMSKAGAVKAAAMELQRSESAVGNKIYSQIVKAKSLRPKSLGYRPHSRVKQNRLSAVEYT